jgi:amino-acid N-acetyltransferase
LLTACKLPVSDIDASSSQQFFAHCAGEEVLGVVGLELYPPIALLRSLAVSPSCRGSELGQALVAFAEQQAAAQGITSLYLLTTTAAPFFATLGYADTARAEAPAAIQATAQFAGLCPASSSFMSKHIN